MRTGWIQSGISRSSVNSGEQAGRYSITPAPFPVDPRVDVGAADRPGILDP